jgi:hypothetical protein
MSAPPSIESIAAGLVKEAKGGIFELMQEGDDGLPIAIGIAKRKHPSLNGGQLLDLESELGQIHFYAQQDTHKSVPQEFPDDLPEPAVVKKMLGRDWAQRYKCGLEALEDAGVQVRIRDPFPLVNKRRMQILVANCESFLEDA